MVRLIQIIYRKLNLILLYMIIFSLEKSGYKCWKMEKI